jgi:hypothetical protein
VQGEGKSKFICIFPNRSLFSTKLKIVQGEGKNKYILHFYLFLAAPHQLKVSFQLNSVGTRFAIFPPLSSFIDRAMKVSWIFSLSLHTDCRNGDDCQCRNATKRRSV